jgi:hypothetical protein
MKHVAPLTVLAFLFLLYFMLPFVMVAHGNAALLHWVPASQDDQGRNEQRRNDQRCDVERPGEGRWNGEGSHEKDETTKAPAFFVHRRVE